MPSVTAYSAADGTPLAGLSPTWATVRNAYTGAALSPEPTFADLGTGEYRIDGAPQSSAGIVDLGSTASPRYVFVDIAAANAFAAFDLDGAPLAGLTPTWSSYVTEATGVAATQPAIVELGGGLYAVSNPAAGTRGVLDLGSTASPRYAAFASTASTATTQSPAPFFSSWFSDTVTVRGQASVTADGDPGYGSSSTVACRVQYGKDRNESEIDHTHVVYAGQEILPDDQLQFAGESVWRRPAKVSKTHDKLGAKLLWKVLL